MRLMDRYSLGYKVLPTLYSGLTDEIPSIRNTVKGYFEELGVLYEKEWEDRLKTEIDYTLGVGNINLMEGTNFTVFFFELCLLFYLTLS
jgi:hypothetical protein